MQETTIVSWFSDTGVTRNAHSIMVAKVLQFERDMVSDTHGSTYSLYPCGSDHYSCKRR